MSVSVTMPRLGESVTEGTVTRWLKQEGDTITADEPLLEVSTDKVDTEVPAPASGILLSIRVAEDETVEIGVELAVIGDPSEADGAGAAPAPAEDAAATAEADQEPAAAETAPPTAEVEPDGPSRPEAQAAVPPSATDSTPASPTDAAQESPVSAPASESQPAAPEQAPESVTPDAAAPLAAGAPAAPAADDEEIAGTYVTPLVRKLASEHGVDLNSITGTGVGGRIRKSDVLAAAAGSTEPAAPATQPAPPAAQPASPAAQPAAPAAPAVAPPAPPVGAAPAAVPPTQAAASAPAAVSPAAAPPNAAPPTAVPPTAAPPTAAPPTAAPPAVPAPDSAAAVLRGRTEKMSRLRQVIAARMVESLQTSAQLTTVVEVDITRIARLRDQAKGAFAQREGVKLSFLPFFAMAAVEALRAHPTVNASVNTEEKTITYHDAEHLAIAVDTDRGLLVPVIHHAGDLNLAGLARKIADLAERTRTNTVSPDELGGGTFTLTNTGSRGALFDTPIINQPQVGILGTGAVVKRPVVISDANLGETIAVRSMVYLALSYDHRLVDGADGARFLTTVKERLELGAFEHELGLY